MRRAIAMLALFAVMLTAGLTGAYAADASIAVSASWQPDSGTVSIAGRISTGSGQAVTVKVLYPTGTVYVNQTTSGDNGDFAFTYKLSRIIPGTYEVYASGIGLAGPATAQFTVAAPAGGIGGESPANGGSGPVATGNRIAVDSTVQGGVLRAALDDSILQAIDPEALRAAGTLIIEMGAAAGDYTSLRLELPAALLAKAGDIGLRHVQIRTPLADFVLAADGIPGIGAENHTIALEVAQADANALPPGAADATDGRPVYDFKLAIDGHPVSSFNGSKAMLVAIPYVLRPGENPNAVVIDNVTADGSLEVVRNSRYDADEGKLSFYAPHFSLYAVDVREVSFNDLTGVPWAKESIDRLSAKGIVAGDGTGAFYPKKDITRAEFAKMLMNGLDLTDPAARSGFADVPGGSWYEHETATAKRLGVLTGYEDGRFGGNRTITREEMLVAAARALKASGAVLPAADDSQKYADADELSPYAADDTLALSAAGIVMGDGEGRLLPKSDVTRAQAAAIVDRLAAYAFDAR